MKGYEELSFTHEGTTRRVFRAGSGPAVIVLHEIYGITPEVAAFGLRVAAEGFTAVLPSFFGDPDRPSRLRAAYSFATNCMWRQFALFALRQTSPAADWACALARHMKAECGGPGVGVVGMCLTGGFALAMMVDDAVLAPVVGHPSLPGRLMWPPLLESLRFNTLRRADVGLSPGDLALVADRARSGVCVLGLRFSDDALCPPERFETLKGVLGERFIEVTLDSSPGNPKGIPGSAHSVLTTSFVPEEGHPTHDALRCVMRFLDQRLRPVPPDTT